ncbi:beta-N-acetylhexosaminidase [Murimonas intestini]|uniref:beta-N-acetylhexosaminidase n=1 Tax=Murimonas intestini TaxID=1337051 RepID=A0AB73T5S7_9FIRM|nr:glycoside hydrolase family 20 zincin-like fold domain-containing protein [Murimonas intestini]MCR1842184.1 family 20 glycosylhydrolase [Murimonas intestini]MCR1864919.1 family 20 glycosylhydrolase [Murimonas intestini]MCR1884247.1 family 20 glycosylhydrolase [Murimonas intestini]
MNIIPQPLSLKEHQNFYLLSYNTYLVLEGGCTRHIYRQARFLQEAIEKNTGFSLHLTKGEARTGDILISYCENVPDPEYYRLEIDPECVRIEGTQQSIIYGIQTFIQVLEQSGGRLPGLSVEDRPRLPFRGFYHDATRGRVPRLSYLKTLADQMMRYKLNQFQLYIEHTYLFRDFSEVWRDDTPLTPEEILELDEYCYDRGIELVPSISTCSHLYKVLRTKQWENLCELENPGGEAFTARERQLHHTVDISNPKSLELIKGLLKEYRPLFRSRRFNICADETFDLGKGRSRAYCEEQGLGKAYVGYVRELCQYVKELGCTPMMWGDVICEYPQLLSSLPEGTVFLNWAYDAGVKEDVTKIFGESKVPFYNCPGVNNWSRLVPDFQEAFENNRRMAEYAKRNHGTGLLNTDWGDYYFFSQPEHSMLGMIYGAQFSWGDSMEAHELNRAVSRLEFGAGLEELADTLWKISSNCLYQWMDFCTWMEDQDKKELHQEILEKKFMDPEKINHLDEANRELLEIKGELSGAMALARPEKRKLLASYILSADGVRYFNLLGSILGRREGPGEKTDPEQAWKLAQSLEEWFASYKETWRAVSKESELGRIQSILDGYCDILRNL